MRADVRGKTKGMSESVRNARREEGERGVRRAKPRPDGISYTPRDRTRMNSAADEEIRGHKSCTVRDPPGQALLKNKLMFTRGGG